MNIVIVAVNFPPLNKIGSRRILSFANGLAARGHSVAVVTSTKSALDGRLDYLDAINPGVEVLEISWTHRTKPASQSDGSESGGRALALLRRLNRWIRWNVLGALLHPYDIWALKCIRSKIVSQRMSRADVVLSSFGPAAPHYVAAYYKSKKPNLTWVADYRDLWSNIPTEKLLWPFSWIQGQVERRVMRGADAFVGVSRGVIARLESVHPSRPKCLVYNGFVRARKHALATDNKAKRLPLIVRHVGTIYPGLRDPSPLFKALKNIGMDWNAEFVGSGATDLLPMVAEYGISEQVKLKPPVSADTAAALIEDADCLLLLESAKGEGDGTLTAKVFEYMASGLPILAVGVSAASELGQILNGYENGYVCGIDPMVVGSALRQIIDSRGRANEEYVAQFERDYQCGKLESFIQEVVAR